MFRIFKAIVRRLLPRSLLGRLRVWRLRRTVARYSPRVVRHNYGGHDLQIRLTDPLASGWYDRDWPVLAEIRFLREHGLRPGATVFDLGAHQGIVALMLAREVTSTGRVVAIEANPHNAEAAEANARLNGADNMIVRCMAVADRPGVVTFNLGLNGQVDDGTGEWGRALVPAVTIDQLAAEYGPPGVLFIDVEGFECHALRGAGDTLARHSPDCFVEVHIGCGLEKFGTPDEILAFFPPTVYSLYRLRADDATALPVPTTADEIRRATDRLFLLAVTRR
jgi:FkbM family methyltransferase